MDREPVFARATAKSRIFVLRARRGGPDELSRPNSGPAQRTPAGEPGAAALRLLDAQRLVPLRHAFGTGEGADLELRHAPADGEMDDRHVLGLARPGGPHAAVAGRLRGVPGGAGPGHSPEERRVGKEGVRT